MIKIFLLVFLCLNLSAQEFVPAKFLGMGSSGYGSASLYTLSTNPSGISRLTKPQIALAYQQHFFGLDIQTQALFFAQPLPSIGNIGIYLQNYGIPKVSSLLKSGVTYSTYFGSHINTSISLNYHQYSVSSYLSARNWSVDLGFQYLFDQLYLGAVFKNISKSTFSSDINESIDQEMGFGMVYLLSSEINVLAEAKKVGTARIVYTSGIQYVVHPQLSLRGGVSANPTKFYAGVGYMLKKFAVDIASSFHTQLGSSPQVAVAYEF